MSDEEPFTALEELDELRARYASRGTAVNRELLHQVSQLARRAARETENKVRAELSRKEYNDEGELRAMERQLVHEQKMRAHAEARAERITRANTNLAEERTEDGDAVLVKISQPRTVGRNDDAPTFPKPWTLAENEELLTRLRVAGAEDDTPVQYRHGYVEARVLFPELAFEIRSSREVEERPARQLERRRLPDWAAPTALLVVLLLALLVLGVFT